VSAGDRGSGTVLVLAVVNVDWSKVAARTFVPRFHFDAANMIALTAIAGTTISPYLFFWQASEEVEERDDGPTTPVDRPHLVAMRVDVWTGMFSGVVAMFAIMCTAAVTLGASGSVNIGTAEQAAKALEPLAGSFAKVLFSLGIIGLGLLAVPVLAGSAAYAVTEMAGFASSLDAKPLDARLFYATIAVTTLVGASLNTIGIDPARALYWAAVVNGILAGPLMAVMMLIVRNPKAMGRLTVSRRQMVLGWTATGVMIAASALFLGFIVHDLL